MKQVKAGSMLILIIVVIVVGILAYIFLIPGNTIGHI